MTGRFLRWTSASLVLALVALALCPAVAAAAPPSLTLHLLPAVPDGSGGWWRTPPEAFAEADQDAVVHYDWGSGEATVAATAGSPQSLGFAGEGQLSLRAFAVSSGEETGAVVVRDIRTDSVPPTRPSPLTVAPEGGRLRLRWAAADDGTSGLAGYIVYRNLGGPPFSAGDAIASVTATSFLDDPGAGVWYYGVRATDRAGNDSLMSEAVRASADVAPPSVPAGLQAWRNGRGFVRVSWEGSLDNGGSGVAYYTVARSTGGAEPLVIGTVPAGVTFFDDLDAEAYGTDTVAYGVSATDRAANESAFAGPAAAGTDLTPPTRPGPPGVLPVATLDGSLDVLGTSAQVTLQDSFDEGSGILRHELLYGDDPDSPSTSRYFPQACTVYVRSTAERCERFFRTRAEDRAGNLSELSEWAFQRGITVDRVRGANRLRTCLVSARLAFSSSRSAVFVNASSFPDGLGASALAGALRAPIVLVGPGPLPADTRALLADLGVTDGWVVGGKTAISEATYVSISSALSGDTTRVAGADRYETASAVASAIVSICGPRGRAFIVSGTGFADALSVGPAAYASSTPVLFATATRIPRPTLEALRSLGVTSAVIVGGSASVMAGTERVVPSATRIAGPDRYATSLQFAEWAVRQGMLAPDRPLLVSGESFPDGLSAASLGGVRRSPDLLVRRGGLMDAGSFLAAHLGDVQRVTVLGDEPSVGYRVAYDAWRLFALHRP